MKYNKYAFSLIEVMIALVVAALIITPLSRLVMRSVTLISQRSVQLDHYAQMQSFLYESRLQDSTSLEFNKEEVLAPRKIIKYTRNVVAEKSVLKIQFLTKETVVVEDKDVSENSYDTLISFFTILPPQKKSGGSSGEALAQTEQANKNEKVETKKEINE